MSKPDTSKAKNSKTEDKPLKPEGRRKAILIVVLCIIVALFIGGRRGLMKRRDAAERYFYGTNDNDEDSVVYYLNERISSAGNLLIIARRYLSENDKLITDVSQSCEKLEKADDPKGKYEYNEKLTESCDALIGQLKLQNLSSTDKSFLDGIKADMDSSLQIMGHLEYNTTAAQFNALLGKFPTNIVRLYTFVRPLTLFEY